ncbi:hypothetical protein NpPPO83_00005548 [Neofusicoccum parvum]|uniref:Uncharacterized protein n=1 Tax=Neofusicoccum parvum TaxID=310453 RepID=A0ACB5S5F7_9PEZI|nr:hypothetical protein NpPPO83_00005548 [Neofusicoccum parvum]
MAINIPVNTPLQGLTQEEVIMLTKGREITLKWTNTINGQKEHISAVPLEMLKKFSPKIRAFFIPQKIRNQRATPIETLSMGFLALEKAAFLHVLNQIFHACSAKELKNLDLPTSSLYQMLKVYAAAVALDIRPTVNQWRGLIYNYCRSHTFTVKEVAALWECLGDDIGLVNHVVHIVSRSMRMNTLPDKNKINDYLNRDENKELRTKFDAVLAGMQAKADLQKAKNKAAWEAREAKRQESWENNTQYDLYMMGFR